MKLLACITKILAYYFKLTYFPLTFLISKDHLGDWSLSLDPEDGFCTGRRNVRRKTTGLLRTPITQMIFFNQGMLLLAQNLFFLISHWLLLVLQPQNGGVVMVNFYNDYLTCSKKASLKDVAGKFRESSCKLSSTAEICMTCTIERLSMEYLST